MDRLKCIKNTLIDATMAQMSDLQSINTEELGEVIDMIKDIEETIYYCHISKAMEESEKEEIMRRAFPHKETGK
jgi:phosphoribosyl 1,2-cyclic phosphodiesterase